LSIEVSHVLKKSNAKAWEKTIVISATTTFGKSSKIVKKSKKIWKKSVAQVSMNSTFGASSTYRIILAGSPALRQASG